METGRAEGAAEVIAHVERAYASAISGGGGGGGEVGKESSSDASKAAGVAPGALLVWVLLNKARVCLLRGDGEGAQRELEAAGAAAGAREPGRDPSGEAASHLFLQLFLRARAHVLQNNHGDAMRMLVAAAEGLAGLAGGLTGKGDGASAALPLGAPPRPRPSVLSNIACVLHSTGRHSTAALLLHRAVQVPPSSSTVAPPPSPTVLYNLGLQRLMLGYHTGAAKCFRGVARWRGERPALWLRLAECAVGATHARRRGAAPESRLSSRRVHDGGGGDDGGGEGGGDGSGEDGDGGGSGYDDDSDGSSGLTSEYALMCLDNASILLEKEKETMENELRAGVSALRAYVQLTLGRPHAVLRDADRLLRGLRSSDGGEGSSSSSSHYALLGRCYAAEALCLLGRGEEAAEHIIQCVSERRQERSAGAQSRLQLLAAGLLGGVLDEDDQDGSGGGGGGGTKGAAPQDVMWRRGGGGESDGELRGEEGDAVLLVHLARACIGRGDLAAAGEHAAAARALAPAAPEPVLLLAYLRLAAGDGAAAAATLAGRRLEHLPQH